MLIGDLLELENGHQVGRLCIQSYPKPWLFAWPDTEFRNGKGCQMVYFLVEQQGTYFLTAEEVGISKELKKLANHECN
jgi:hypothetical protein